MIGLIISVFIILLFALVVEIAATALKFTGLNIEIARFQALSALTGTGFTSHEAESVVAHPKRRKIIMALMILGPVGFLTLISMVMISIGEKMAIFHLGILVILISLILLFTRSKRFLNLFHGVVEGQFKRTEIAKRVELEEVLQLNREYGVCEISVEKESNFTNKNLSETNFKDKGFIVLAIKRDHEFLAVPQAKDVIHPSDVLVVFGNLKNIKEIAREANL